jgi:predicted nucleotidyltransferase
MHADDDDSKDKQGTVIPSTILTGIRNVTQQIVQQFHPQKVILFGSYAYGQPTEDNDVDLLVVMDTDESPLHVAAKIAAAIEHPFPLDIVVRTPVEFTSAVRRKGVFATEVATKGITLYEAGDARVD